MHAGMHGFSKVLENNKQQPRRRLRHVNPDWRLQPAAPQRATPHLQLHALSIADSIAWRNGLHAKFETTPVEGLESAAQANHHQFTNFVWVQ